MQLDNNNNDKKKSKLLRLMKDQIKFNQKYISFGLLYCLESLQHNH